MPRRNTQPPYSPRYYKEGVRDCYRGHVGGVGPFTRVCGKCHSDYIELAQAGKWTGDFPSGVAPAQGALA